MKEHEKCETEEVQQRVRSTRRAVAEGLEEILLQPFQVLDHGFVRVIDYMGDDSAVVQAARVSYGRGTKQVSEDRGLIRYLMRHNHTTPFEMASIKLHIKLPIFVARQWIRHRTASVNEYSARYSILDSEFYVPSESDVAGQSTTNRQGRSEALKAEDTKQVLSMLRSDAENNYEHYQWMLNSPDSPTFNPERQGLARELARINLTLNTYTQWYWKIDLHNLLHFLRLRADPHAQHEIREYAEAILGLLKLWVPFTYEAFIDYKMGAVTLSRTSASVIKRLLAGEQVSFETSGLSAREWRELVEEFGIRQQSRG
ncbi:FAD-dependent thymidylate synthase [Bradyrhizobium sp. 146]|uniref:FAD-dependent thymidylate synthase n=1 Tax=Bradyrhizobium sp. 146 TaxID=2782622 RepID=UPI001FFBC955